MSRVYFHSPSGDAELMGTEYHWLRSLVYKIAVGMLDLRSYGSADRIRELIQPGHYLTKNGTYPGDFLKWVSDFETAFVVDLIRGNLLGYAGKPIATFSLALNTAALVGNDQIKLATRLAGQGEIHAYVEGPNRAWLADMMQRGIDSGVFRKGMHVQPHPNTPREHWPWQSQGWEDVIALLRARDDEPVVTSYSVTGGFPRRAALGDLPPMPPGWRPDDWSEEEWAESDSKEDSWEGFVRDEWSSRPAEQQWAEGMEALRTNDGGLEIKPDDWDSFRFTHELTVLDLYAHDWRERLDAAPLGCARQDI